MAQPSQSGDGAATAATAATAAAARKRGVPVPSWAALRAEKTQRSSAAPPTVILDGGEENVEREGATEKNDDGDDRAEDDVVAVDDGGAIVVRCERCATTPRHFVALSGRNGLGVAPTAERTAVKVAAADSAAGARSPKK